MMRVLIANRGEIAVRLARAAREAGLAPVGIASEADRHALHRRAMDESLVIGPAPASLSYLSIEKILWAAQTMHAQLLHPGYGFLSERADFAQAVGDAGLIFVGPSPESLTVAGDKRLARRAAKAAGIPTLDGYDGSDQTPETLLREAENLGYPVLIKASNGGGGRGQRAVSHAGEFLEALAAAQREALAAFGDASVLLERYITQPRHIEFQIVADGFGNVVSFGERDCSLQRRRQKVLEEAPAAGLALDVRAAMSDAAIAIARAAGYRNAGTVEFLLAPDGRFYFLEMNARLQVEHPVTEMVTGVDLAVLQYRIALGEPIPPEMRQTAPRGWALEARICAEDPAHGLLPAGGEITAWRMAQGPGIRVDAGFDADTIVPLEYDSLLAKLIVWAPTREGAYSRMRAALHETVITGVPVNIPFLAALCEDEHVLNGHPSTTYIDDGNVLDRCRTAAVATLELEQLALALAAALAAKIAWRLNDVNTYLRLLVDDVPVHYRATRTDGAATTGEIWACRRVDAIPAVELSGAPALPERITLEFTATAFPHAISAGRSHLELRYHEPAQPLTAESAVAVAVAVAAEITAAAPQITIRADRTQRIIRVQPAPPIRADLAAQAGGTHERNNTQSMITAPMPGRVLRLLVQSGDTVADRQLVAVLEAMKMEHRIEASGPGRVRNVFTSEGGTVTAGAPLVEIGPLEPPA